MRTPTFSRPLAATALCVAALLVHVAPASAQCAGDCNGDGQVAINELITGVNIALGSAPVSACASVDVNGDGQVAINELIGAVNNALGGCVTGPTATPTVPPTATATPTGPTPSATPTRPMGGTCGNGIIENAVGETCDDGNTIDNDGCPSTCRVALCTASGQRLRVDVNFASDDPNLFVTSLILFLRYPDGTLDVPGVGDAPPVLNALTSDIYAVTPRDFDYAVRVLLEDPTLLGYTDGTAVTVEFDVCQGAIPPPVGAIACTVEGAGDPDFVQIPPSRITCTLANAD